MRQFLIISLAIVAVVAGHALAYKIDNVTVNLGNSSQAEGIVYHDLDDSITFRDLAERCLHDLNSIKPTEDLRMENNFGLTYNLDKTLKEAGIKDGTTIKLKNWSRALDLGANMFGVKFE